jgi:hypothetical protein
MGIQWSIGFVVSKTSTSDSKPGGTEKTLFFVGRKFDLCHRRKFE